jgi:hypothetical protein
MTDIREMQQDSWKRHQEILDLIEALSDSRSSDGVSSVWNFTVREE